MTPQLDFEPVGRRVGNAAGTGARLALVSLAERRLAAELARRIEYVELTVQPDFGAIYARSLRFAVGGTVETDRPSVAE